MRARNYEVAHGVWIAKPPEQMTQTELIEALDQVAEFASRKLADAYLMRDVLAKAIKGES